MPDAQQRWPNLPRWPQRTSEILSPVVAPIDLLVDDALHAQSTDAIALTQTHALAVNDATHAQSTDAITLTQVHVLTVNDSTHAQSTDGIALTQTHVLSVDDALHSQSTDAITLTGDWEIPPTAPVARPAAVLL